MIKKLVGWLLHHANSSPPVFTTEFYALKSRLCEEYGTLIGHEWQHIRKECWTCLGAGLYEGVYHCRRCCGTGVYLEHWHKLEVWQIAGHQFHRPVETRCTPPNDAVTIRGKMEKDGDHYIAREACLWLYLIFNPPLWLKMLRVTRTCYPEFWPMLRIQVLVYALCSTARRLSIDYCASCSTPFLPSYSRTSWRCDRCTADGERRQAELWAAIAADPGEEIPF